PTESSPTPTPPPPSTPAPSPSPTTSSTEEPTICQLAWQALQDPTLQNIVLILEAHWNPLCIPVPWLPTLPSLPSPSLPSLPLPSLSLPSLPPLPTLPPLTPPHRQPHSSHADTWWNDQR
ncbi:hypothetical protein KGQ19_23925, partial [Catenulispora sp. NL8]